MTAPPLFGLVLAGGASRRMGQDKATLAYHGKSQLQWSFDSLHEFCERTFVSVRPEQRNESTRAALPQIVDLEPGIGPIAGINAALTTHPDVAWLVLACDLPFLSRATLQNLVAQRDRARIATAYRSSHDGLPEPLCAIWEPSSAARVSEWIASGKECPRKLLINSDVALLDQIDTRALDNVNTPQERDAANHQLGAQS
jgi:molybdopterin-guanine dinucleotide biosynthesis protein A